ncbi:ABC transporter ATP-binding protein [Humibacter ginsengisoli]
MTRSSPQPGDRAAGRLPSIIVNDVTKSFKLRHTHSFKEAFVGFIRRKKLSTTFSALSHVSIEIKEGESVALLGYNGSGKSTLLKLISGVFLPDKGRVLTRGRVAGLIEVGAGFHPDLTGRDNVYLNAAILGMSRKEIDARFDDIVEFSEIADFIDTEVKHYSSGMFLRLAFSVAIHTELDVLLVDEILAVGDAPFRAKCERRIRELIEQGKTMVVVSHDLEMVTSLCERGVVLRKGDVVFDGPIDEAASALSGLD